MPHEVATDGGKKHLDVTEHALLARIASAARAGDLSEVLVLARLRVGLSQRKVEAYLRGRGLACSTTTLSAWERGDQAPRRASSRAVLDELDRLYRLPRGTLRALGDGRVLDGMARAASTPFGPLYERMGGQSSFRTWDLHDFHTVGPERAPVRHRTRQLVEAVEVRLERYLLGFDTRGMARAPDVEGVRGCRIGRRVQEGAQHVVELLFGDVVEPGATHLFEYATTLAYDRPPPPHLRRAVQTSMRQMIVLVEFTCEPPRRVDRCVWSDDEGTPRVGGRLRLASDCTVHTVFDTPRVGALHGLRWCWS